MSTINFASREITCKIVYYGPGLSGKTTNLLFIHKKIPAKYRSDMVSLATDGDRTLFFDFLPLVTHAVKGFTTRFQLYTVPGQVFYNATRKLVLQGVDGIVFVADSAWNRMNDNHESFINMKENLADYGLTLEDVPYVLQFNKRDLPNAAPVEYMNNLLNREKRKVPYFEAIAIRGIGVFETLNAISKMVLIKLITDLSAKKET
ncbi:MAG: gliding-motility protein MglA [Thermoplasmata archaeon]|nr:MAG: gliding-motility protein MglA [Thermoplasmata archaeon]